MEKRISKRIWYGNGINEEGKAIPPKLSSYDGAVDGLNEGEFYINNASEDPTIFIRDNKGNIIGFKVSSKINLDELNELFLRKDQPDTAQEAITFLKGLISEGMIVSEQGTQFGKSFASGLTGHGGLINSLGQGELESLVLRRFLEAPELRFNRVNVTAGDLWLSPGGGLIESVEPDMDMEGNPLNTGTVTLKLEPGEIGTVAIDDICMGMYHYESGNATEDYDDGIGNRRMSGFSSSSLPSAYAEQGLPASVDF